MGYKIRKNYGSGDAELVLEIYKEQAGYQHILSWDDGASYFVSLNSRDILTPVLTDLHVQDDLFFFSGNAAEGYWSMSIAGVDQSSGVGRVRFEIACRVTKQVAASEIGSVYVRSQNPSERYQQQADLISSSATVTEGIDEVWVLPKVLTKQTPYTLTYTYDVTQL